MTIHAMTVCVNYSDLLSQSIGLWTAGLESLTVVTHPDDKPTIELAHAHNCHVFATDAFYRGGGKFNKGRAMTEAFSAQADKIGWFLHFDSDIVPPENWREQVERATPEAGNIYGCWRTYEDGRPIRDGEIAGFFHLAHFDDPNMKIDPIFDVHFYHAGNYDTTFQNRWPLHRRIRLPITMKHLGDVGVNWCGRGQKESMRKLHEERRRRRGRWDHETL